MAVLARGGRGAVTHYRCLETFGGFTLVEFRLETGRTHQVRVHCASLSCPIVGDDVYGRPRNVALGRGAGAPVVAVTRTVAGWPAISVPFGYVWGLPVGVTFVGPKWTEPRLIALAYAFEQAACIRRPPRYLPAVE